MIKKYLNIFILSSLLYSCTNKDTASGNIAVSGADTLHADTIIKNEGLIVVEQLNTKTGKTEDVLLWKKFPESLTFENFKSIISGEKKQWTGKLNFDALNLKDQPEEMKNVIIDSLNKKNAQVPEANFNGNYKIVTTGIRTDCCFHFLIDLRTGKVTRIGSSLWGADFRPDSYLLILNPPDGIYAYHGYDRKTYDIGQSFFPDISNLRGPEAYLFLNNEFKRVY